MKSRVVGADEFKQALLKYANRRAKGGKPFTLLSIQLSNHSTIESVGGEEALEKLMRGVRGVLRNVARASDLVCSLSQKRMLVLSTEDDHPADSLRHAFQQGLSELKIAGFQVRPKFAVDCVTSEGQFGDLDSMLETLGCRLNEHDELTEQHRAKRSRSGAKDNWLQRYRWDGDEQHKATDRWSQTECFIVGVKTNLSRDENYTSAVRIARSLQSLDHPGIQPLVDFWIDDEALLCVEEVVPARKLKDWCGCHRWNAAALSDMLLQYLSILIYLQTMTPPVMPSHIQENLVILPGEPKLFLANYQHKCFELANVSNHALVKDAGQFAALLTQGCDESQNELSQFIERINNSDALPPELGTLHKVRASLREIADKLGAPHVMPNEKVRNA